MCPGQAAQLARAEAALAKAQADLDQQPAPAQGGAPDTRAVQLEIRELQGEVGSVELP